MHCATVVLLSVTLLKGTGALIEVALLVSPPVVALGEDVELVCIYDLQDAPLYGIKFYKDAEEFYRFNPFAVPPVKLYPIPGLLIDLSQSQDNRDLGVPEDKVVKVVVRSAGYSLAGTVTCEVSSTVPFFNSGTATQNITVVVAGTRALRGVALLVSPPVVERGKDVELVCNYDMQGAPLYAIKFYRGTHEFYRFSPFDVPPVKLFPFPGLDVDLSQSRDNRVVLRSADYSLAGAVSCEVSSDQPHFHTGTASQNITVVELPRVKPRIETETEGQCEAGDRLKATCTSAPARPAPSLTWFINDEPATTSSTRWNQTGRLETRRVTLDIVLLPRHVASGHLTLRCTALVASVYKETDSLTLDTRPGSGEPQHERVRFSSAALPQLLSSVLDLALALLLTLR